MANFLTEKRREIEQRLEELRPLHDEFLKLERAVSALDGVDGGTRRGRPRGSGGTGRPRAASATGRRRRGGGRRRGGETRADQALEVVRQNPGISVSDIGNRLGIAQKNYLYRVMANLESKGAVRKDGRGFSAA